MNNKKENLEGLVSKLKEQGISAGKEEQQRIIESAKGEAKLIISGVEKQSVEIVEEAKKKAAQIEENAQTTIAQAARDMLVATRVAVLEYLKSVFGEQCESLFKQEQYFKELLMAVVKAIPGDKKVSVPDNVLNEMEAFLLKQALSEQVVLKPLGENNVKIVVESTDSGNVQFVLSSKDLEDGLFSMLNKDLVERITKGQED
jgi:V/A-type H+/Na+-transporting ATPase subunit E